MIFGKFQISVGTAHKITRSMQIYLGKIDRWVKLTALVRAKYNSVVCVAKEEFAPLLDKDKGL